MQDFLKKYCNWNSLETIFLTVDIDWAPEYMIENIVKIFKQYNVSATVFATHKSDFLFNLQKNSHYELGIHPNLSANSTQGDTLTDIIDNLKSFYNNMSGCRFHLLDYSYRDLDNLSKKGFKYDVSTLHMNKPCIIPICNPDLKMTMLTYIWEDGPCENAHLPMTLDSINLDSPGMKIINFHPLNVFLNGQGPENRLAFIKDVKNITDCPEATTKKYRSSLGGVEDLLHNLLQYLTENSVNTSCLSELVDSFEAVEDKRIGFFKHA